MPQPVPQSYLPSECHAEAQPAEAPPATEAQPEATPMAVAAESVPSSSPLLREVSQQAAFARLWS